MKLGITDIKVIRIESASEKNHICNKILRSLSYLARPGMPTLIELQERSELMSFPHFVEKLIIPGLTEKQLGMLSALHLDQVASESGGMILQIKGRQINFENLI